MMLEILIKWIIRQWMAPTLLQALVGHRGGRLGDPFSKVPIFEEMKQQPKSGLLIMSSILHVDGVGIEAICKICLECSPKSLASSFADDPPQEPHLEGPSLVTKLVRNMKRPIVLFPFWSVALIA